MTFDRMPDTSPQDTLRMPGTSGSIVFESGPFAAHVVRPIVDPDSFEVRAFLDGVELAREGDPELLFPIEHKDLMKPDVRLLIMRYNNVIVAGLKFVASTKIDTPHVHIGGLWTDPQSSGRGIAKLIVSLAVLEANEEARKMLDAVCEIRVCPENNEFNKAAQRVFQSLYLYPEGILPLTPDLDPRSVVLTANDNVGVALATKWRADANTIAAAALKTVRSHLTRRSWEVSHD